MYSDPAHSPSVLVFHLDLPQTITVMLYTSMFTRKEMWWRSFKTHMYKYYISRVRQQCYALKFWTWLRMKRCSFRVALVMSLVLLRCRFDCKSTKAIFVLCGLAWSSRFPNSTEMKNLGLFIVGQGYTGFPVVNFLFLCFFWSLHNLNTRGKLSGYALVCWCSHSHVTIRWQKLYVL